VQVPRALQPPVPAQKTAVWVEYPKETFTHPPMCIEEGQQEYSPGRREAWGSLAEVNVNSS